MTFNPFKKTKQNYPEFWKQYLLHFNSPLPGKTLIDELHFVVFDTETTGLNSKQDKILSIGAVHLKGGELDLANILECKVQQEKVASHDTIPVHGILPYATRAGTPEMEAVSRFVEFCKGSILVGHHVTFDVGIINEVLKREVGDTLKNQSIDTFKLAIRLEQSRLEQTSSTIKYSLDALCNRYDIQLSHRHTALGDAYLTALLLLKLLARLKKRGVRTLQDLDGKKGILHSLGIKF